MKHLVKIAALIYVLFSLASCSRTPGISHDEEISPATFEGEFGIYVRGYEVNPRYGQTYYRYKIDGIYLNLNREYLYPFKVVG